MLRCMSVRVVQQCVAMRKDFWTQCGCREQGEQGLVGNSILPVYMYPIKCVSETVHAALHLAAVQCWT